MYFHMRKSKTMKINNLQTNDIKVKIGKWKIDTSWEYKSLRRGDFAYFLSNVIFTGKLSCP